MGSDEYWEYWSFNRNDKYDLNFNLLKASPLSRKYIMSTLEIHSIVVNGYAPGHQAIFPCNGSNWGSSVWKWLWWLVLMAFDWCQNIRDFSEGMGQISFEGPTLMRDPFYFKESWPEVTGSTCLLSHLLTLIQPDWFLETPSIQIAWVAAQFC